jgi:hypothetical protein
MMDIASTFKLYLWIIILIPVPLYGQLYEDFTDGEFTNNPAWNGDINKYRINDNFQLQLDDNKEGDASLFTMVNIHAKMEWRCWTRLSFSPSANNNARVYLSTQLQSEDGFPDGVFLQFGESGSFDALKLMVQHEGDTSTMIKGSPGLISSSFRCRVKVVFEDGNWQLFADYHGENNYLHEGTIPGELVPGDAYFGVSCKYTVSNSTKFYFDDFYAGPIQYDTIPPSVARVSIVDALNIEISYSEYVDTLSALDAENYIITPGNIHPVHQVFSGETQDIVTIHFSDSLAYGQLIELNIVNVTDLYGNTMVASIFTLAWYHPERYEVIINEIMADPSPPQLLPEYEYLELFNATHLPLDLSGWTLSTGGSEKSLTGLVLPSQAYIVIGKEEARNEFLSYGPFYGLESFSLVNSGQEIILRNQDRDIIHAVNYNPRWYNDNERSEGGWSLELIDPFNPCLADENWHASSDISGGTPGRQNSVYNQVFMEAEITAACVVDSGRIRVVFNQSMGDQLLSDPDLFSLDHHSGTIQAILPDDPYFASFILYPKNSMLPGNIYSLSLNGKVYSCVGDTFYLSERRNVGIPEQASYNDLVINEILFDPFPGGTDYVEIYNRSEKALDLNSLILASVKHNPPSPPDTSIKQLNASCSMIMPGEYFYLCDEKQKVCNYYTCSGKNNCLDSDGIPAYSNEEGVILLMDASHHIIDEFSYHEDMHYPFLNSIEGISLERIHYDRPASDITNWHSASQLSGFGTPGYINSQFAENPDVGGQIRVEPGVFKPGNDGLHDHVQIHFTLDRSGFLASIYIFNTEGVLCKHLINNELLGTSGSFSWNGIDEKRQRARAGIYIVLAELVHPQGEVIRFKETLVVAP